MPATTQPLDLGHGSETLVRWARNQTTELDLVVDDDEDWQVLDQDIVASAGSDNRKQTARRLVMQWVRLTDGNNRRIGHSLADKAPNARVAGRTFATGSHDCHPWPLAGPSRSDAARRDLGLPGRGGPRLQL